MIQLIGLLLMPSIGILALILRAVTNARMSEEKIVASVAIATAFLFFLGVAIGFGGISFPLISSINFSFTLGLTGISIPFLLLAVIMPALGLWSAHKEIKKNKTLFYILYMFSYLSMIAVFISTNLILLFIFWEIILISFFFIIMFWGEKEIRRKASMKFLIFTQFGSLTLLGAFILLFVYTGSFDINVITASISMIPPYIGYVIFFFVLITALIKMPIFPFHSWLPDAHVDAPTAGSVLLAGVLLKLGGYALLLFGVMLFPAVASSLQVPLIALAIFTMIYATLVASAQKDFKRLVAYSSIFYMSLAFLGIMSLNYIGQSGAIVLMVSHGFIVGMLFVLAGLLKEKTGTRDLDKVGGLMLKMPMYAFFIVFGVLATLGVPGLSNFPGELLVFIGAYGAYPLALLSLFAILIATNYYLSAVKRILFVALPNRLAKIKDISPWDAVQLSMFSIFVVIIGILPSVIVNSFNLTV